MPPVEDHVSLPKTIQMEKIVRVKPIGGWLHVDDVPEIVSVMRQNLNHGYLFNTQEFYIPIQTEDVSLKIRAPYEITDTRMGKRSKLIHA